jgi:isopenicillin N synthase-like dioxygenase
MHPNNTSNGSAVIPLPPDVPQAQVECIDLYQLQQGNQKESEMLFRACKTDGVFYLDISGLGQRPIELVDAVYQLNKEFHELPLEEKMQYDADKLTNLKLNG